MTDADKLAAFKALAGDLGKSMKEKVTEQGEADARAKSEAAALQERLNVERMRMLTLLENDIDALGWDAVAKGYAVSLAEDGTEQLNLIGDLPGDPVDTMMRLAITGELITEAVALVVSVESWAYPEYLEESIRGDKRAREALWALFPPGWHPENREFRTVTLVDRTGQSVSVTREKGGEAKPVEKVDTSVIRAMKCLLGLDRKFNKLRDKMADVHHTFHALIDALHQGSEELWVESQYIDALLATFTEAAPNVDVAVHREAAERIIKDMPTPLRRHLGLE